MSVQASRILRDAARRRRTAAALGLERLAHRTGVDARWSRDCLLRRGAGGESVVADRCERHDNRSRIAACRHFGRGHVSVDLAATFRGDRPVSRFKHQPIDVDLQMLDLEAGLVNDTIDARPFANSTRVEASARFSPDGRRIAFSVVSLRRPEVWIAGRDGSGIRQLTTMNAAQLVVADGRQTAHGSCSTPRSTATAMSTWLAPMAGSCVD